MSPSLSHASELTTLFRDTFHVLSLPYRITREQTYSHGRNMRIGSCVVEVASAIHFTTLCRIQGYSPKRLVDGFADFTSQRAVIREGPLPRVFVTAAHELGHLLNLRLSVKRDEEAKAYAFAYACVLAVRRSVEKRIADEICMEALLQPSKIRWPAHHKAHGFVLQEMDRGTDPLDLYRDISLGLAWVPTRQRNSSR